MADELTDMGNDPYVRLVRAPITEVGASLVVEVYKIVEYINQKRNSFEQLDCHKRFTSNSYDVYAMRYHRNNERTGLMEIIDGI